MAWPHSQDYNEAIQSPRSCMADPELRDGEPVTNAMGIPQPRAGNFADVYQMYCPRTKTRWALKCFTREVKGLGERYAEVSSHLARAQLPFTVDFQYLEKGVRIRGTWYPALKMRWVEGLLLNEFVRDNLDKPARLQALSQIWLRMAKRLREARMAHADLQHGNVILVPGSTANSLAVKLIDYDGMWVPALASKKSGEVGHPNYQHPQRLREGIYSGEVDRFPLLVVATALRALATGGPALWQRYDNGDNLLFKESDLRAPGESALFRELRQMPDALTQLLAGRLANAVAKPLDDAPLLEALLPEDKPAVRTTARSTATATGKARAEGPDWSFEDEDRPAQRRSARDRQARTPVWVWAAGGAVALLAVAGGVALSLSGKGKEKAKEPASAEHRPNKPPVIPKGPDKPLPVVSKKPDTPPLKAVIPSPKRFLHLEDRGYVELANTENLLDLNGTFTVEMWARTKPGVQYLVGDESWPTSGAPVKRSAGWVLRTGTETTGDKSLNVSIANGENDWFIVRGEPIALADDWHHLAVVKRPHEVVLYRDGKEYARKNCVGETFVPCASNLYLGVRKNAWKDRTVDADILAVRISRKDIYQKEFTPPETLPATPDSLLVLDFTGGDKSTVPDLSGHKHDGLLVRAGRVGPGDPEPTRVPPSEGTQPAKGSTEPVKRFEGHTEPVFGVAFSPDGRRAVSGSQDKTARVWNVDTGKSLQVLSGHSGAVTGVAFSPDGSRVATAGVDGSVRLWDPETGKELARLIGHRQLLKTVAFSPDGRFLLSASDDKTVRLWDVRAACQLRHFDYPSWARCAVFSPDNRYALSGCEDKNVRLFSPATGRELRRLTTDGDAFACAFLSDGYHALSASFDGTVRLWDLVRGKQEHVLRGHQGQIWNVAISPTDRHALSCGEDKTIRLWDLASGREIQQFPCHCRQGVAFSPDGRFALSGSQDNVMYLWRLPDAAAGKASAAKPRPRYAMPSADAQAAAESELKERYKADYALRTVPEREALATKLLERGLNTTMDPAICYICLREARDIAARAGNFALSQRAVDELVFLYAANELEERAAALKAARAGGADPGPLAAAALDLIADAVAADNYEMATALGGLATGAARAARNVDLLRKAKWAVERTTTLSRDYTAVRESAEALARSSNDEQASLALGKFRCFRKEDWTRGLPLLAGGSDKALADLARHDLADPATPADLAELGHRWWDVAAKEVNPTQVRIQRHARVWFRQALPRLTDLERSRVEDKLKVLWRGKVYRPGLVTELFADEELKSRARTRIDYVVDYDWGFGAPAAGLPVDHFSVRWQGWLIPPQSGKYTLILQCDDAGRVLIDNQLVIDGWKRYGRNTAEVVLGNRPHHLQIECYEITGSATCYFRWIPEGGSEQAVPMDSLYHDSVQEKLLKK